MGWPTEFADVAKRFGPWWTIAIMCVAVHWLLVGGLATFVLWPDLFEKFELSKLLFLAALLTLPFFAFGAGAIMLGAMDHRPFEPQARYAVMFSSGAGMVCQGAALWSMFLNAPSRKEMMVGGVVALVFCLLAGFAKRREAEEDARDEREGIRGQKSFFRGPRKPGAK